MKQKFSENNISAFTANTISMQWLWFKWKSLI